MEKTDKNEEIKALKKALKQEQSEYRNVVRLLYFSNVMAIAEDL